jgi:hypothetical protein
MPSLISPGVYDVGGGITVHLPTLQPSGKGTLTALGWRFDICGKIEGLTARGTGLQGAAVAAIQSVPVSPPLLIGVGLTGQPGATLQAYHIDPKSNGVVEFSLEFSAIGAPQTGGADSVFRVINTAIEQTINKSVNGNLVQVTYNGQKQVKGLSVLRPQPIIEVTRLEPGYPTLASETYVGTVNVGPCPWDAAAPNRCWLCTGVDAESRDLKTWSKTYRFQYADPIQTSPFVGGWDKVISFTNPDGNAPSDIGTIIQFEDGTKPFVAYQVYRQQDFSVFAFIF